MKPNAILLVDDEPGVIKALCRLLEFDGHRVLTAGTTKEAMDIIASESVAVVISDFELPDGNGAVLLATVRDLNPRIRRIALTGCDDVVELRRIAHRYVAKPWRTTDLRELVDEELQEFLWDEERDQKLISLRRVIMQLKSEPVTDGAPDTSSRIVNLRPLILLQHMLWPLVDNDRLSLTKRVAKRALKVATDLGLGRDECDLITAAALVHRVGELTMPASLLKRSFLDLNFYELNRYRQSTAASLALLDDKQGDVYGVIEAHREFPVVASSPACILGTVTEYEELMFFGGSNEDAFRKVERHLLDHEGTRYPPAVVNALIQQRRASGADASAALAG